MEPSGNYPTICLAKLASGWIPYPMRTRSASNKVPSSSFTAVTFPPSPMISVAVLPNQNYNPPSSQIFWQAAPTVGPSTLS